MNSFKEFIDFLKLPPNILAAISIVTGLVLFLPNKYLEKLYMVDFKNNYGFIISILFLISSAILVIMVTTYIYKKLKNKISDKKLRKYRIKYLLEANENKMNLIKEFINDSTHTLTLPMNDGLVIELSHFYIITMAGGTQLVNMGFDNSVNLRYFLQPWVINLINSNAELKEKYLE